MDQTTKSQILARLYQIDLDTLVRYVESGQISLEEMISSGSLSASLRNELEKKLHENATKEVRRREAERKEEERNRNKEYHIKQINNNNLDYDETHIKRLINAGELTQEDLINNTYLTREDIGRMYDSPEIDTDFLSWEDLPKLEEGRTDVYVFGVAGSGKSCLLAGILYYGERSGRLGKEVHNVSGTKYMDELIKRISLGILPKPTDARVLNYISVPFYDDKNRSRPLSIIEMSGEKFTNAYEKASIKGKDTIGARDYLQNSNRKIIMFVVDYLNYVSGLDKQMIATQSAQLGMALALLAKDGTLDKTDAVFIVVTKCDKLPEDKDIKEGVQHFLEEEYLSFLNNCRRKKLEHKFDLVVHPFSLGKFKLSKNYTYEQTYSSNIFNDLVHFAFLEKKKKWWDIF